MKNFLILIAVSLAAVACGKDKNKNPFTNIKEAVEDKDLQGKSFQSECSVEVAEAIRSGALSGLAASTKSSRTMYRFVGANITKTTVYYSSADCAGEAYTFTETGDFNITKNQKTNDGGYNLDINYKKLTVKVNSDVGVTAANATKLCGATDWAVGQERDVSAQAKDATCYNTPIPRSNANIYRIDGGNVLLLGSDTSENAKARPAQLSGAKYTAK